MKNVYKNMKMLVVVILCATLYHSCKKKEQETDTTGQKIEASDAIEKELTNTLQKTNAIDENTRKIEVTLDKGGTIIWGEGTDVTIDYHGFYKGMKYLDKVTIWRSLCEECSNQESEWTIDNLQPQTKIDTIFMDFDYDGSNPYLRKLEYRQGYISGIYK